MKKTLVTVAATALLAVGLSACSHSSDVVSKNLSNDADNYKVFRQIVVYNSITDKYIEEVEGYCAVGNNDAMTEVTFTCKSPDGYVKDIIERSDNTLVVVHQLYPLNVSADFFKVTLKPSTVIPDFNVAE